MSTTALYESILQDVKYGIRTMRKNPAFSVAVVLKLICETVESGLRPDAAKAARRVPREDRPLTGARNKPPRPDRIS